LSPVGEEFQEEEGGDDGVFRGDADNAEHENGSEEVADKADSAAAPASISREPDQGVLESSSGHASERAADEGHGGHESGGADVDAALFHEVEGDPGGENVIDEGAGELLEEEHPEIEAAEGD